MAYQAPQTNYAQGPNVQNQAWQNNLCNCSPCESCLLGTFLPCMLLGRTADRMRDPTMATADNFNSDCLLFCGIQAFTGCGWIYIMMKRGEIRERFGIRGSGMGDCCTTYWCPCCALIQQDNEAKSRLAQGPVTRGYQANKEGMQVPQAMQAPQGVQSPPPMQSPPVMQSPPIMQSPAPMHAPPPFQGTPPPQQVGYHTPQGTFPVPQQQQYNPHQPPQKY